MKERHVMSCSHIVMPVWYILTFLSSHSHHSSHLAFTPHSRTHQAQRSENRNFMTQWAKNMGSNREATKLTTPSINYPPARISTIMIKLLVTIRGTVFETSKPGAHTEEKQTRQSLLWNANKEEFGNIQVKKKIILLLTFEISHCLKKTNSLVF